MDTSLNLYDYVMAHLRAKQIPQRRIARESGVPFSTVCKIAQGSVTDPSVHTVQRLANYFKSQNSNLRPDVFGENPNPTDGIPAAPDNSTMAATGQPFNVHEVAP